MKSSSSFMSSLHHLQIVASSSVPYVIPCWCQKYFTNPPKHGRIPLAHLPTPLYRVFITPFTSLLHDTSTNGKTSVTKNTTATTTLTSVPWILQRCNCTLYIKRDDCTHGIELGGNKIRKLEFLLAEAMAWNCDSILTIGGIQSNHCRATASVTRMMGLQPHLILRQPPAGSAAAAAATSTPSHRNSSSTSSAKENDVGLVGNLLFDRMVGSRIYTCTAGEYGRIGSTELLQRVARYLQTSENRKPYIIPVGGSNGVGTWGYINAVDELLTQWNELMQSNEGEESELNHIVVACGSGGTTAGIALGIALAYHHSQKVQKQHVSKPPVVHAIGVCDDADYFYQHIAKIADEMGFLIPKDNNRNDDGATILTTEQYIRQHLVIHQGKGRGYGQSTKEELDFIVQFAQDSGVVLDTVYTGKALYNFFQYLQQQYDCTSLQGSHAKKHQNILFWHTGGGLGLFDKCNDLTDTLVQHSPCQKLDVYGSGNGIDIST
jgi:D-cysteine desulfhydrase family pyridoxal phosphate-dependent enzyme